MKTVIEPMRLAQTTEAYPVPARQRTPLAPLLAGARARGVADGLEWLGVAAVLLDDRGEALHVNAGAVELLGEDLFLAAGRLRARAIGVDRALHEAIRGVIEERAPAYVSIPSRDGEGGVALRVASIDSLENDPFQLLRAVAILERIGDFCAMTGGRRH